MCFKAVNKDGCALEYVPEELKDEQLCKLAVKGNGYALSFVPKK